MQSKDIKFNYYFFGSFLISLLSFTLGFIYMNYSTDIHHWSFILEPYFEYSMGKEFYKEIYLQYGSGIYRLMSLLSNFVPINFFNLGLLTSFIFSIKFIYIFKIFKFLKIQDNLSLVFTFCIFLIMTHAQVPWPDIYCGTVIVFFFYLVLKNQKKQNFKIILLSSFLLFLTIYLRNTYLLNYILCFSLFFIFSFFFKTNNSSYINKIFNYSLIFILIYFSTLYFNKDLYLWYIQGIGESKSYLGLDNNFFLSDLKQFIFIILRFAWHLIIPKNLFNLSLTLFFLICLLLIYFKFFKKKKISLDLNPILFFFICYGFGGLSQNLNKFESLRYMNSSISLYFISFLFLYSLFWQNKTYLKISIVIFSSYILLISIHFPQSSNFFPLKENDFKKYEKTNFAYFGDKMLPSEYQEYYGEVSQYICKKSEVYNLSFDRTFNYLCKNKPNKYSIFDKIKLEEKHLKNSIIITHYEIENFKLVKKINIPKLYRYTYSDKFFRFFPDVIFFYEKN